MIISKHHNKQGDMFQIFLKLTFSFFVFGSTGISEVLADFFLDTFLGFEEDVDSGEDV